MAPRTERMQLGDRYVVDEYAFERVESYKHLGSIIKKNSDIKVG